MRVRRTCSVVAACIVVSASGCITASAQTPTTLGAAGPAAQEFERLRFIDFMATHGSVEAGGQIDAPSNTVSGVYVKAGTLSTLSTFTFPLTVGLNPFQRLVNPNTSAVANAFAASVLEVSYAPLYLQREARADVPSVNHTVGHTSQALTASFTIEAKNLDTLYLQGGLLRRAGRQFSSARQAWADSLRGLSLTTTASYTGTWNDAKQDQVTLIEVASKALPASITGDRLIAVEGSGGLTVFPPRHAFKTFYGITPTGALRLALMSDIQLRLQVGVTHFAGAGFRGIDGVFDKSRDTEVNFTEVLVFPVAGNQPLRVGVKQVHVGTGSADIVLTTEIAYKFANFRVPVIR